MNLCPLKHQGSEDTGVLNICLWGLCVSVYIYIDIHTYIYIHMRLPTGWTVRRSNHGGGEIFRTCPDRPWGPHSLMYNGYRVFPGGKVRRGRDAGPSPHSSAEVKNRVELYLTLSRGLRGLWQGETYIYIYIYIYTHICISIYIHLKRHFHLPC
jgi:hypothetical protein